MSENLNENYNNVLEEQRHVSSKISDLCRYIGFGIAAASYTIFSSNSDFAKNLLLNDKSLLIFTAISALIVIFSDYLQFLCGYISVREAINNPEDSYQYKLKSKYYKGRFWFFIVKQIATCISVILLMITLIKNIA